jgi:4-amino-4-deoxy-L-arabinose transferase-like glycosyltransferase
MSQAFSVWRSLATTFGAAAPKFRLTRVRACVLITLIWAGVYLPGLGSVQLEHEEPRRALPALHMLASGDWLVPRVGSEPYLRKPPLLNWAIALSCGIAGAPNEWAVRLPSVLSTLALALTIVISGSWLGTEGAFLAAVFFLVNFTMIETGRLAELEALYIALTGIGLLLWMAAWMRDANPWQLWLLPAPFLALGMLTKGPTHLIFYYGMTLSVLAFGKKLRLLLHPAHWLALALIVGLLGCWAVPCSLAVDRDNPMGVWHFWWGQLASRASTGSEEHFHLGIWLLNGPQTLKNFLPWTLMLPLLWRKEVIAELQTGSGINPREYPLFRGARWGMVATCLLMVLLPKGSPRYIYPLIVVPCLLLARALSVDGSRKCPAWLPAIWERVNFCLLMITSIAIPTIPFFALYHRGIYFALALLVASGVWFLFLSRNPQPIDAGTSSTNRLARCALVCAATTALAMIEFTAIVRQRMDLANGHKARPLAGAILKAIPSAKEIWVMEESYRPFWYYLEPRARYFVRPSQLPSEAEYFLVPPSRTSQFMQDPKWNGMPPAIMKQFVDNELKAFDLLKK